MRTSVELHSIHSVKDVFDPKVLEGRVVLAYGSPVQRDRKHVMDVKGKLIVEGSAIPSPDITRIVSLHSHVILTEGPDGIKDRVYSDFIRIKSSDQDNEPVKFIASGKDDIGKLVVTQESEVIGVVMGSGIDDGEAITWIVPAYCFLHPQPEPIRESLKGKFDVARLEGRTIVEDSRSYERRFANSEAKVFIEGKPGRLAELDFLYDVELEGKTYQFGQEVRSHCAVKSKGKIGLKQAYREGLFSGPDDVGKLVLLCEDLTKEFNAETAPVLGVVVGQEIKYYDYYGPSWIQKTYICPARDLLIP